MRIKVVHGKSGDEITKNTNKWLEENEDKYVILSISPAMPKGTNCGGYVTIVYNEVEKILAPVENSRNE
jgi:hypothetical protein